MAIGFFENNRFEENSPTMASTPTGYYLRYTLFQLAILGNPFISDRLVVGGGVPRKSTEEMRVGPSESAYRSRLQTTLSCNGKEPLW